MYSPTTSTERSALLLSGADHKVLRPPQYSMYSPATSTERSALLLSGADHKVLRPAQYCMYVLTDNFDREVGPAPVRRRDVDRRWLVGWEVFEVFAHHLRASGRVHLAHLYLPRRACRKMETVSVLVHTYLYFLRPRATRNGRKYVYPTLIPKESCGHVTVKYEQVTRVQLVRYPHANRRNNCEKMTRHNSQCNCILCSWHLIFKLCQGAYTDKSSRKAIWQHLVDLRCQRVPNKVWVNKSPLIKWSLFTVSYAGVARWLALHTIIAIIYSGCHCHYTYG